MQTDEEYVPSTGCPRDERDERDLLYKDVMGAAGNDQPVDWDKGYDANVALGLPRITQDQGGSSSCTAQGTKSYTRRRLFAIDPSLSAELSALFVYAQTALPGGGAYIRDAIAIAANMGMVLETALPSYENGQPPSEQYMTNRAAITAGMIAAAKALDRFNYRMIEGDTGDIEIFAHAILNNYGVVGGFTGTNQGWCRCDIRPPKTGESKWGHCVDLCAFGKLDVPVGDLPVGTKCVFTANSWGGRYVVTSGRWKGYQAIPEAYFKVSQQTAAGLATGVYVFNSWVLVPDSVITDAQRRADLLKTLEGKDVKGTGPELYSVSGGLLRRWPDQETWWSYGKSFTLDPIKTIADADLAAFPHGADMSFAAAPVRQRTIIGEAKRAYGGK